MGPHLLLLLAGAPVLLGGFLPLTPTMEQRWCWTGRWRYPVGEARDFRARDGVDPPYALLRGFSRTGERHLGADIGNGRAGGPVRAAAHGLVVQTVRRDTLSAWGDRVVLAHRLDDGRIVFSVYAHLLPGSIRVKANERVAPGAILARVGRSGNATTPHLHFEVRLGDDPQARWENATATDPLEFVAGRLPHGSDGEGTLGACTAWADAAALLSRGATADRELTRADWWLILGRAARHDLASIPADPESLSVRLRAVGLLPSSAVGDPAGRPDWKEIESGLRRLRHAGNRLPPPPPLRAEVERALAERGCPLASRRPAHGSERSAAPAVADAVLLVARDAALDRPPHRKHRTR